MVHQTGETRGLLLAAAPDRHLKRIEGQVDAQVRGQLPAHNERYARRMNIEQRLIESIRSFHIDALSGAVPLNVDLDITLSVLAGAICASLRRRLTGYHHATPRHPATTIPVHHRSRPQPRRHITVQLNRRTYSPVLRQADIPDVTVPWWGGHRLHLHDH